MIEKTQRHGDTENPYLYESVEKLCVSVSLCPANVFPLNQKCRVTERGFLTLSAKSSR